MADTMLGAAPGASASDPGPEQTRAVIDRDLYGADHPPPKEMFAPEVALREPLRKRVNDVANVLGLKETDRQARHREMVALTRASGLSPALVGDLYDQFTDAQLADARGTALDQAEIREWQATAREQARLAYGKDTEDLLGQTDTFIRQHPHLQRMLETRGIGARWELFQPIVDHVRRQRFARQKK